MQFISQSSHDEPNSDTTIEKSRIDILYRAENKNKTQFSKVKYLVIVQWMVGEKTIKSKIENRKLHVSCEKCYLEWSHIPKIYRSDKEDEGELAYSSLTVIYMANATMMLLRSL